MTRVARSVTRSQAPCHAEQRATADTLGGRPAAAVSVRPSGSHKDAPAVVTAPFVAKPVEVCERGRDGLRGADVGDGALGPSTVGEQLQGDLVRSGRADFHRAGDQPSSARWRATTRPIPRGAPTPVTTAVRSCWKVVMSTRIGVSLMCPAGSGSWGGGCDAPCRAGLRSQLPSSPSAPGLPRWTVARRRSPRIPRRRVLRSR